MNLDINATTSEFGCYVDRFTEILTQMKDAESNIVSSNTLYAILAGAFLSIIDGAYVSGGVQDQFWIFAGAVAATYYSVKAIFAEVSIDFRPKSSNLKEIYYNPEKSKNFSSALWFIMTRPLIQNEKPIREMLIERWIENGFLGKDEKADRDYHINLFFGTGGISNITHISNRREMNNEVKTMIQLLSQDINAFMIEIISGYQPSKN
jgi:hypothetical protein